MYHFLYKVTNKINGKIYIGVHSTTNLDDGYIGSGGKAYKNAIKKYGKYSFEREIIEFFQNEEEMYEAEKNLVTEEFVKDKSNYNQNVGGNGGFHHINSNRDLYQNPMQNEESRKKMAESYKKTRNGKEKRKYDEISIKNLELASQKTKGSSWYYDPLSLQTKRVYLGEEPPEGWVKGNLHSKNLKGRESPNKGNKLSQETKQKMKDSWGEERKEEHKERMREKMKGNSVNKGKVCYYDPSSLEEGMFFDGEQPEGWNKGSPSRSKKRNRKKKC